MISAWSGFAFRATASKPVIVILHSAKAAFRFAMVGSSSWFHFLNTHMNVSAFDIWVVIYKNWTSDQMTWDMHRNDVGHAYIHADDAKKVIYIYMLFR